MSDAVLAGRDWEKCDGDVGTANKVWFSNLDTSYTGVACLCKFIKLDNYVPFSN